MIFTRRAIPFLYGLSCPNRLFILVTVCTCIRRTILYRLIRSWHAKAMIPSVVNTHIGPGSHVTIDAQCCFSPFFMKMMCFCCIDRFVTTQTKIVSRQPKFSGMRIMTIGATHIVVKHFALCERTVFIIFFLDLSIRKIHFVLDDLWDQIIHDFICMQDISCNI